MEHAHIKQQQRNEIVGKKEGKDKVKRSKELKRNRDERIKELNKQQMLKK